MGGVTLTHPSGLTKFLTASNKLVPEDFDLAYGFTTSDGVTALVSKPMLDRLSILGVLKAEMFGGGPDTESLAKRMGHVLKDLKADPESGFGKPKAHSDLIEVGFVKKGEVHANVLVGDRQNAVRLTVRPITAEGRLAYALRLEWNPRKAGASGNADLYEKLWVNLFGVDEASFRLWLAQAKVTRMDIAVDVLGVSRVDFFGRLAKTRKRQIIGRVDHPVETSIHRTGDTFQGKGSLLVYDKRQHYLDQEKQPKFGTLPHVRIERSLGFKKTTPALAKLSEETNRLADVSVRLLRSCEKASRDEQRVALSCVHWLGRKASKEALHTAAHSALPLLFETDPDFWRKEELWAHWPASLKAAGLAPWMVAS